MYPLSYGAVMIFREAAERVVDKYGWEKFDGPTMKKEMEGIRDFGILGDLSIFTYSEKRRAPETAKLYQAKDGKWIAITGWKKCPDTRPPQYR